MDPPCPRADVRRGLPGCDLYRRGRAGGASRVDPLGPGPTTARPAAPDYPLYAIGANLRELLALTRRLVSHTQSRDPSLAGYRVGIVGSLWLLGLVAVIGIPVGIGAGVYLEEYARPGRLHRLIQT